MSVIRITSSTMGRANPSPVTGRKPYRWRGIPGWTPEDPRYRGEPSRPLAPALAEMTRAKELRLAEFARLREQDVPVAEAAELIGVHVATGRAYERERMAALRKEEHRG